MVSRTRGNAFLEKKKKMASQLKDEIKLTGQTGVEFGGGRELQAEGKDPEVIEGMISIRN